LVGRAASVKTLSDRFNIYAEMKPSVCVGIIVFCALSVSVLYAKEPVDYINPFIGAGSTGVPKDPTILQKLKLDPRFKGFYGKTFPGAATPGGMVQLSPDTITGGSTDLGFSNGAGYSYPNSTIQGFSFTHVSGVGWFGELGNFMVMPTTGPLKTYYGETDQPGAGYLSSYSHDSEVAQAGYYAVTLDDYKVRAEMTAAPHSGILRFTFPKNPQSRIQIDLARRVGGTSLHQTVKVVGDNSIEGQIDCTPEGGGFGHGKGHVNYTIYYHAEFSKPLKNVGVWSATLPPGPYNDMLETPEFISACQNAQQIPGCQEKDGQHLGFYAEFPTEDKEAILLKAGISYVSIDGARANLAAEIPGWDFDGMHKQARDSWAAALDRMSVEGGTEDQKTAFYTALYHALLDPRIFADLKGDYPGGDGQIHHAENFTKRTLFSGWDVFRSEYPLLTLIAPQIVNDQINSVVELATQNGLHYYDRWELMNCYTGCMNGSPEVVVINDAYQKGIRGYDVAKAYEYAVNTCEKYGNGALGYQPGKLSGTLQNTNDDWNLSRLATALGKTDDAKKYSDEAFAYQNLFDPAQAWTYDEAGTDARADWKGWFRAKDATGAFLPWEGLTSIKTVIQASVYQTGWFVPYDIPGLIKLNGGKDLFIAKLTDFFTRTPNLIEWNNYENQPNEPSHLIPFLFNRAGAPWLTQKWVRTVASQTYGAAPNGLCGDEDAGQMSAWFVLAASGLHQACPGDPRFEIFTPLFDKVTMKFDPKYAKGSSFVITAKNNSPDNIYIQSATLNGQPLNRCWLSYQEITAGGTLDLVLGVEPNKSWGIAEN